MPLYVMDSAGDSRQLRPKRLTAFAAEFLLHLIPEFTGQIPLEDVVAIDELVSEIGADDPSGADGDLQFAENSRHLIVR